MEYYGNNDWRDYLRRQNELAHFGIPKRSGRYPWGSGENPYHHGASAPGGRRKKLKEFLAKVEKITVPKTVAQATSDAIKETKEKEFKSLSSDQQKAYTMIDDFNNGKRDFSDKDYDDLIETGRLIRQKGNKASNVEKSIEKHIGEIVREDEERTGIIRTNETYISNLKNAGYKIEKAAYGTDVTKSVKARNAKGDNIDLNIRIDGQIYDDRWGGSVKIPSNELKDILKDVEQNWSSYDKVARERAVDDAFNGGYKPWGYDDSDATPELSKLTIEEQKKDYYNRLGKDFWTNGAKESPIHLNVYVNGNDDGSSYLGEVWYDNGGVWGDHSVTVDIDLKRKKAGNVSIQG